MIIYTSSTEHEHDCTGFLGQQQFQTWGHAIFLQMGLKRFPDHSLFTGCIQANHRILKPGEPARHDEYMMTLFEMLT